MAVPPYPSVPSVSSFAANAPLTAKALRDDVANAANFLANRPLFEAHQVATASINSGVVAQVRLDTTDVDTWQGHTPSATQNNYLYYCQAPGWYVAEGLVGFAYTGTTAYTFAAILEYTQSGVTAESYGEYQTFNSGYQPAPYVADLILLTKTGAVGSSSADTVALAALQDTGAALSLSSTAVSYPRMSLRWVAAASGTTGLPVPANPAWPSPYTSLTDSPAAGATSITVASATGMVTGGYLQVGTGTSSAETVTITSVAGTTIGVSALAHSHSAGDVVAVPVSSAFADIAITQTVQFLTYPPVFRAWQGTAQTLTGNQTWPTVNTVTLDTVTVDNYSGWSAANHWWVAPVAGVYWIYAQVGVTVSAASTLAAGITVNSTTYWVGDSRSPNAGSDNLEAGVKRLRLNAGDQVSLSAYIADTSNELTFTAFDSTRMCIVWESS